MKTRDDSQQLYSFYLYTNSIDFIKVQGSWMVFLLASIWSFLPNVVHITLLISICSYHWKW